jgi:hypothetical protein
MFLPVEMPDTIATRAAITGFFAPASKMMRLTTLSAINTRERHRSQRRVKLTIL